MADTDLDAARARRAALKDTYRLLQQIDVAFYDHAVRLAVLGPLRTWAASMPIGTVARFDDLTLVNTRDQHVLALVEARTAVARAIDLFGKEVP